MVDEGKVTVTPDVQVEVSADESLIDNRRADVENQVITENNTVPEVPKEEATESKAEEVPQDPKPESEEQPEESPIDRIKKSVQKRIDKVVAQKKSAEEELAEARAEIERLKANSKAEPAPDVKNDVPPTIEQVEAYIIKMREEGNAKEEIAATRYLIKLEKESAIKEVEERQTKVRTEVETKKQKQLADWVNLSKDYVAYTPDGKLDPKSDLNLSNQNGILYKTALSLYQDKELHADFYNDPDTIQGFRRAVADAYREIHQQGLVKSPRIDSIVREVKPTRIPLADPSADSTEEPTTPTTNLLSDADKVREEIKARNKNRLGRRVS